MEKERKITAPEGCEIEKVEIVDGVAVVTFKEKERGLPKSWEEFCEMFPLKKGETFISFNGAVTVIQNDAQRDKNEDKPMLPDRATAEAVLALCQLIQLRDCYNGDWVPDWTDCSEDKFVIDIYSEEIKDDVYGSAMALLYFKTEELRDEFLRYFHDLIEKLKPLYGIKEGGEE